MKPTPDKKSASNYALIKQVTRSKDISASTKVLLTYCLVKYQATDQQGNPWNFSNASIQDGTGIPERTVRYVMQLLIKAKVLKHYGCIKVRTRPMNLYLFVPEALDDYLNHAESSILLSEKDTAKEATPTLTNASKDETPIDDSAKTRDTARDTAKTPDHKEVVHKEELLKKKEDVEITSTGITTLMDMEQELNDGFYEKSVYPSIVPDSPVIKDSKKRFQVPYGIDDKFPSPSHSKYQGSQSRPFSIVFNDPILRAELDSVYKNAHLLPDNVACLSYQDKENWKDKSCTLAVDAFKRKHNLI